MARGKVFQSSHLQTVLDYQSDTGSLTIQFTNGAIYRYSNIPFSAYRGLTTSNSPGAFFSSNIRGKYGYVRLDN